MKTCKFFTSLLLASAIAAPGALAQGTMGGGGANLPSQRITNESPNGTGAAFTISPATLRRVQQELNRLGYNAGTVDGNWDRATELALVHFQQARGLQPTGRVNESTLNALGVNEAGGAGNVAGGAGFSGTNPGGNGAYGNLAGGSAYHNNAAGMNGPNGNNGAGTNGAFGNNAASMNGPYGNNGAGTNGAFGNNAAATNGAFGNNAAGTNGAHGNNATGMNGAYGNNATGMNGAQGNNGAGTNGAYGNNAAGGMNYGAVGTGGTGNQTDRRYLSGVAGNGLSAGNLSAGNLSGGNGGTAAGSNSGVPPMRGAETGSGNTVR